MKTDNVIADKSKSFALRIIKLYRYLSDGKNEYILSKQILRSGTSIGANVREATRAQSKADFNSKIAVALKEAEETAYWLELLFESDYIDKESFDSIYSDCTEICRILMSISKTGTSSKLRIAQCALRIGLGVRLNGLLCWWWLRSPGNNQNNAANVNNDGSVNYNGNNVNNDNDCVRPALLPNGEKPAVGTAVSVGSKGIEFPLGEIRENRYRRARLTPMRNLKCIMLNAKELRGFCCVWKNNSMCIEHCTL